MENHSCVKIVPRSTDYIKGVNSPINFKAVSNGNWTSRLEFFESQKIQFETNGCVLFTAQESFDAQMDNLIVLGQIPQTALDWFTAQGYMDMGFDGKLHFHSSARFLEVLTGNGLNGNSLPDAWDVMRKYGVLPWKDFPYDSAVTETAYLAPVSQASLDKAAAFLSLIGGKNATQYHWIVNGGLTNLPSMTAALTQAPLCIGIAVAADWNQVQPSLADGTPGHSVMNYFIDSFVEIYDHYLPAKKELSKSYPIHYVLQGIVSPLFAIPTPPPSATVQQEASWIQLAKQWIVNAFLRLNTNKLQADDQKVAISEITTNMNYSIFRSKTFYTLVFIFLFNGFAAISTSLPADAVVSVNAILGIVASIFHLQTGQSTTGAN